MNAAIKHGLERAQGENMDIMLTGDAAQRVLALAKNDHQLATLMAQELVITVDRTVMTRYLLTDKVARDLLARRVTADPETTLAELQRLAAGKSASKRKTQRELVVKTLAPVKPKTRVHMTAAQVAEIKTRVLAVLKAGPASRKQLRRAVKFPSISVYNRIMGELRAAGLIIADGNRGKTVYMRSKAKPAKRRSR
jgi:hypothetical protein